MLIEISPQSGDQVKSQANLPAIPSISQSVKFETGELSSLEERPNVVRGSRLSESRTAKPACQTGPLDAQPRNKLGSQGREVDKGVKASRGPQKCAQDERKSSSEAASVARTPSQGQSAAGIPGADSRASRSALDGIEYAVAEDGNIHINDKQKAAIRRLMQPKEQEEDAHLGFTKQGKPIKANPYFKYALRAKDDVEDGKPTPAPVVESHSSRLTRHSRRDSTQLPAGRSAVLEKVKEEFCEWLASLGSGRNMTVTRERLEELFSLGLENNLVVRPPEVRMTQSSRRPPSPPTLGPKLAQQTQPQRQQQQQQQQNQQQQQQQQQQRRWRRRRRRHPVAAAGNRRRKTEVCRSPSLIYYPELRQKWRQMGLSQCRPIWRPGRRAAAPAPSPRVRYGHWYIPISKWTPLVAGRRLAPPETEQARQLRQRELANTKLNETLSRSHAMSALREYIHICQLQGDSAFPEATPRLVRDVDELVAETAIESRRSRDGLDGRVASKPMVGLMVRVLDKGQQRRQSSTTPLDRPGPTEGKPPAIITRPPPMYRPLKTAPGQAAQRNRKMTLACK